MAMRWPGAAPAMPGNQPPPDHMQPPGNMQHPPQAEPAADGRVVGYIDGVSAHGAEAHVSGWACHEGWAGSIQVHVYAGGRAGIGQLLGSAAANQPSENAVAAACGSQGQAHRFDFQLTADQRRQYESQAIFVHGISPVDNENVLVERSGSFVIPPPN